MKKLFACVVFIAVLVGWLAFLPKLFGMNTKTKTVSGIQKPSITQTSGRETMDVDGKSVRIEKRYAYDGSGIVRMVKKYNGDSIMDKVGPMDVGLLWGSAAAYNDRIDYRWFYEGRNALWTVSCAEEMNYIDLDQVLKETEFACLIPQNESVRTQMEKIKMNQYIRIKGFLADAYTESDGNCVLKTDLDSYHVIYVTDVEWLD